jgi:hypothetical protein
MVPLACRPLLRAPRQLVRTQAALLLLLAVPPVAQAGGGGTAAATTPNSKESFAASSPAQIGLSEHLRRQGYLFYGAWWCPACRQQKSLFGQEAARRLPYVECDNDAAGQQRCAAAGIRAFPTWTGAQDRRQGVQTLQELKRWSGYRGQ